MYCSVVDNVQYTCKYNSKLLLQNQFPFDNISGVMVSIHVLLSNVVGCGFKPLSGQIKDCKISICCFSAKHEALRSKSKDWLAWNQDNVSECGDMSVVCTQTVVSVSQHYINPIKYKADIIIIISLKSNLLTP